MCHFLGYFFGRKINFLVYFIGCIKFLGQDFSLESIFGSDCHETLNYNQLNMKYHSKCLVSNIVTL